MTPWLPTPLSMLPVQEALRVTKYDGKSAIDRPRYSPAAAARHLRLPVSTVRWWTLGNGPHLPAISIAEPHQQLLSFRNLVEIHVLSSVMCQDRERIPLAPVRTAVAQLAEHLGSVHPLADGRMPHEGKDLLAARLATLTNATQFGEAAIASILACYLKRVRRDERGEPLCLLLFTRARPDGPEHIMIDPAVQAGQPCVTGTQVTTALLCSRFRGGESALELAEAIHCEPEAIEEALRYEMPGPTA